MRIHRLTGTKIQSDQLDNEPPHSYLKCIIVMVNEGKALNGAQILKPETVDEMWKDQLTEETNKGLYASIPAARPDLTNPTEVYDGVTLRDLVRSSKLTSLFAASVRLG